MPYEHVIAYRIESKNISINRIDKISYQWHQGKLNKDNLEESRIKVRGKLNKDNPEENRIRVREKLNKGKRKTGEVNKDKGTLNKGKRKNEWV